MEYSSKWNTPIIKMEHSYYQKEHSYQKGTNRNTRLGSRPILCRPSCFLVKWMILQWFPLKIFLTISTCLFSLTQGSPPFLKLDFGLCARVSPAVCEPTIPFSHSPAVSPFKSRDFRSPEPTIPFYPWSAVSHPKPRDFR